MNGLIMEWQLIIAYDHKIMNKKAKVYRCCSLKARDTP